MSAAQPPASARAPQPAPQAVLAALLAVAALLRFATIAQQSYWLDEGYTVRLLRMPFGRLLDGLRDGESSPPGYFVLAWGWAQLFGDSAAGLRSLSALAGTLTVIVVYAIGARLGGRAVGLAAGALAAVHPLLVWFSQEARPYALATLLSALSLLCVLEILGGGARRWWIGFTVSAGLALATHYYAGFFVIAELGWLAWRLRGDRRVLVAAGALGAVVAALAPLALAQRRTGNADVIGASGLATRVAQIPKQLLVGYASPAQALSTVVIAALVLFAAWRLLRAGAGRGPALGLLAIAAAAIAAPVVAAVGGLDYLNTRNLLPTLPALLVVLAAALASTAGPALRAARGAAALLVAVLLAVTLAVTLDPGSQRDDWSAVAGAMGAPAAPRAVVISPGSGWIPLGLYLDRLRPIPAAGADVREIDVVAVVPRRASGGRGASPPAPAPPAAGFRALSIERHATYSVTRFAAPAAARVTAAALVGAAPLPGDVAVFVQGPS